MAIPSHEITGFFAASAKPFTVASNTRKLVKAPGPASTAIQSISWIVDCVGEKICCCNNGSRCAEARTFSAVCVAMIFSPSLNASERCEYEPERIRNRGGPSTSEGDFIFGGVRTFLVAVILSLLSLVEDAKSICFYCGFLLLDDFTTIQTFPPFEINRLVEKGLHYHHAGAFWTVHSCYSLWALGVICSTRVCVGERRRVETRSAWSKPFCYLIFITYRSDYRDSLAK